MRECGVTSGGAEKSARRCTIGESDGDDLHVIRLGAQSDQRLLRGLSSAGGSCDGDEIFPPLPQCRSWAASTAATLARMCDEMSCVVVVVVVWRFGWRCDCCGTRSKKFKCSVVTS